MTTGIGGSSSGYVVFGEIERVLSRSMAIDSNIEGKNSFGSSLSTLFGGFSIGKNSNNLTEFPDSSGITELVESGSMPQVTANFLRFSVASLTANGEIISDENIPETLAERQNSVIVPFSDISKPDVDSLRPAALKSPVWIEGPRILSSGTTLDKEDPEDTRAAGPLNIVFDKRRKVWEQPVSFPCPAVVIDMSGVEIPDADPVIVYRVRLIGAMDIRDVEDENIPTSGVMTYGVNDGRTEIGNVFDVSMGFDQISVLPTGQSVTLFYNAVNDSFTCSASAVLASVYEATADGNAGNITAKLIDSSGELVGEDVTFRVLPDPPEEEEEEEEE